MSIATLTPPQPCRDNIIVRQQAAESVTEGGIVLPDAAQRKVNIGQVVAVSKDVLAKDTLQVGDTVIFQNFGFTEIEVGGEPLLIMAEDDVLAVINQVEGK